MPDTSQQVCETLGHSGRLGATLAPPMAGETVDVINDEILIEAPPNRRSGTIRVKLHFAGRSTPIPAEDPWAK